MSKAVSSLWAIFFFRCNMGFLSFTRIVPPHQLLDRARHSVFHLNEWVCFFFVVCLPSSSIAQYLLAFVINYLVTLMQFLSFVLYVRQNEFACLSNSAVCGPLLLTLGCMKLHLCSGGYDRCFPFSYHIEPWKLGRWSTYISCRCACVSASTPLTIGLCWWLHRLRWLTSNASLFKVFLIASRCSVRFRLGKLVCMLN